MYDLENERKYLNGESCDAWKFLGSHVKKNGVDFCVWAPSAKTVRVIGGFNNWGFCDNPEIGRMEKDELGFWHSFVPDIKEGEYYKYQVIQQDGTETLRSDPLAIRNELRPGTASIVTKLNAYRFTDKKWQEQKHGKNYVTSPMNIYELHLGSWRRGDIPGLTPTEAESCKADEPWLNYREIADKLADYVSDMGYTHVELMPVSEHPLDESWGYQTLCFFAITSRYGTPDDLRYFVNKMHSKNIGVIFDWVPGHFCKDISGLYNFDGAHIYEGQNEALRENLQWGTANFDFSNGGVISFLISNAIYYFKEYHVDGLRVDAVTNILCTDYAKKRVPALLNKYGEYKNLEGIEFLRKLNKTVYREVFNPLMIAEESTAWPLVTKPAEDGGLGFTFKWNMGWMNDTLEYISMDPIYRQYEHNKMTFSLMYAFAENYILPISHDEVVHGKRSLLDKCYGTYEEKFKEVRCYLTYMIGHPGKKLSFMGNEFGPFMEWRWYEELEWKLLLYPNHSAQKEFVKRLNHLYLTEPALSENDDSYYGFEWIDADNTADNTYVFRRNSKNPDDFLIFIMNFSPCEHKRFRVGIPRVTDYEIILSTDNEERADEKMKPEGQGANGKRFSVSLDLAPYEAVILKPHFSNK